MAVPPFTVVLLAGCPPPLPDAQFLHTEDGYAPPPPPPFAVNQKSVEPDPSTHWSHLVAPPPPAPTVTVYDVIDVAVGHHETTPPPPPPPPAPTHVAHLSQDPPPPPPPTIVYSTLRPEQFTVNVPSELNV